MSNATCRVEACVIGAGVVGLAVARALAKAGKEVLILERASNIGTGTCICVGECSLLFFCALCFKIV
jgi:L-2-hydroxyglutarate oxidase LhgO